jgi:allophanate hydrolase
MQSAFRTRATFLATLPTAGVNLKKEAWRNRDRRSMDGVSVPSIAALKDAYASGALTPRQMLSGVLARIAAWQDPAIWISRFPDDYLFAMADRLAAAPAARTLALYGVPFAVKDNIDAVGLPTTAGCPAFSFMPKANAASVQKLIDAGAIPIGKTNLDQFATGLVGTRSPYGAPRCVFNDSYVSGGSSSGSAVSVAAGLVSFALGTDTAGSGRVPAGFNNIVGLKPTKGLVSTAGVVPACRSLDCVSIFAQNAADALAVLQVVQGEDEQDPFSRTFQAVSLPSSGLRFGVLSPQDREFCGDSEAEALYDAAIGGMRRLGGTEVVCDYAPFRAAADLLYGGPYVAERLAAIETFFNAHPGAMDPVVHDIIAGALRFSAVDAFRGSYRLRSLAQEAVTQWRAMDVMLLPTAPTIFRVAEVQADPIRLNALLGIYTNFVNLLDYAAIALPAGFRANGLPAGVTLVGPAFSDHALARLASRLHAAAACGAGLQRDAKLPLIPDAPAEAGTIDIAVAGAHLSGMALNHQLGALDAMLVTTTRTSPEYRLMALSGTTPAKPGLVRTPGFEGPGIEVEIWRLSEPAFGRFVAALPSPMGIGKIVLADASVVCGFLCEPCALEGAEDITAFGGWRAYLEVKK